MSRVSEELIRQLPSRIPLVRGSIPAAGQKVVSLGTLDPAGVLLLRKLVNPCVVALTLWCALTLASEPFSIADKVFALVAVLLTTLIVKEPNLDKWIADPQWAPKSVVRTMFEWSLVLAMLTALLIGMRMQRFFSRDVMTLWGAATAVSLAGAHWLCALTARRMTQGRQRTHRHIVIGINELSVEFVRRMRGRACASQFMGYFDFRDPSRLMASAVGQLKGHATDVAAFVQKHAIHSVYIAVPISNAPRIRELLAALRDTTASIYFVPDLLSFDLVQPRLVDINGLPAFSVTETPLQGLNGLRKRISDIILSLLAIALLWPLMLAISAAVALDSRGPVIFGQRRYGLNGEQIVVLKFRTMTVCEDGAGVVQATQGDRRITRLGGFLRRTSLDELPQIFNVLLGHMSLVGPRPHAVAHNELYRKLISGYMVRHKVRPGITGWAQVNGLRGETATIDRMEQRVRYDLEYLRDWSLSLDLRILLRTLWTVLKRENAY